MAFNPIHSFRKHQKVFLAALTIMTMFIFIFQFSATSGGDFFSEITRIIAGRSARDTVATIYGQDVRAPEIEQLQRQRQLANDYIFNAIALGHQATIKKVETELLPPIKDDETVSKTVNQVVTNWKMAFDPSSTANQRNPQFAIYEYYSNLRQYVNVLKSMAALLDAKDKRTLAGLVRQLGDVVEQDMIIVPMTLRQQGPPPMYFGNGSTNSVKDLVDFKIWLHKADELGIQLTKGDIGQLLKKEARGELTKDDDVKIIRFLRGRYKFATTEMVQQAISNEFRVRLAQAAVMGYDARPRPDQDPMTMMMDPEGRSGRSNLPEVSGAVTPYDAYSFFKEHRSESIVAVLPIPVNHKGLLAKVGEPTDAQLLALFDKYKSRESTPDSDKPGFKQPPRVSVEWIGAKADSPFYQEQAKKLSEVTPAVRQAAFALAAGSADAGVSGPALLAAPLAVDVPLVLRHERERGYGPSPWMRVPSRLDNETMKPLDANVHRAENVAALWGQALGAAGSQGTVLTAPLAQQAGAIARDVKERTRLWSDLFLAGTVTGTNPLPFIPAALVYAEVPKSEILPLETVRDYLKEQEREELARRLVSRNMLKIRSDLEELREDADTLRKKLNAVRPVAVASLLGQTLGDAASAMPNLSAAVSYAELVAAEEYKINGRDGAEMFLAATSSPLTPAVLVARQQSLPQELARAYIDRAISEYGLAHGGTEKPRDREDIAKDEGLKTLKESYLRFGREKEFPQKFFSPDGPYVMQRMPQNPHARGMEQEDINQWSFDRQPILYWKTSETPARVPTFGEAYERVKERWKFDKARALARAEAERLAVEARKVKGDADRFLKDGSAFSGDMFMLPNVSRLERPRPAFMTQQSASAPYKRYKIPEDKIEHPTGDFLEQILALKNAGDVIVLHDRAQANYYVVAFMAKMPGSFFEEYTQHSRELLTYLENENHLRQRYREEIVKQLQQEARLKINEDLARDFDKRNSEDER